MIRAVGTCGSKFVIDASERTSWDDIWLDFRFELDWVNGRVRLPCSEEGFEQFKDFIRESSRSVGSSYTFMIEDGSLEIKMSVFADGVNEFEVVTMPDMIWDDMIRFGFVGRIGIIVEEDPEDL